jgi:glycosyltransferase involved in cell wall biosynthesis
MNRSSPHDDMIPPAVAPVAAGEPRPLWSVMIPTFNCAAYLRHTLESVLDQDPGPGAMQIEVVDDCSTRDDPEAVVREMGGGRVTFHRRPANGGATRNFNTCIDRSRGHLVHILHGDDLVLPGFYRLLAKTAERHPDRALFASRALYVDEAGVVFGVSDRVRQLEDGGTDVTPMLVQNRLCTPSIVIRRGFYERHGGFRPELVHTADWEMWTRAIGAGGGVILPDAAAQYREFAANDTSRLRRQADNLRDVERAFRLFAERYPAFDWRLARERLERDAAAQVDLFRRLGDRDAQAANLVYYRETVPPLRRAARRVRAALHRIAERIA